MSYQERIENTYNSGYAETRPGITFYKAAKIASVHDVENADARAAQDIATLEGLIADLKEYRQALAARYAQLETMSFSDRLELQRVPSIGNGVTYYIRLRRRYEDGVEAELQYQRFEGKQRREAIKRFEELKKQRPGIEAIKDIEKKSWER